MRHHQDNGHVRAVYTHFKPHFYMVKLGYAGVYLFLLIFDPKHRLWVLIRTAALRRFYRVPTINVLSKNITNIKFFLLKFSFFTAKNLHILHGQVFVMHMVFSFTYAASEGSWKQKPSSLLNPETVELIL